MEFEKQEQEGNQEQTVLKADHVFRLKSDQPVRPAVEKSATQNRTSN